MPDPLSYATGGAAAAGAPKAPAAAPKSALEYASGGATDKNTAGYAKAFSPAAVSKLVADTTVAPAPTPQGNITFDKTKAAVDAGLPDPGKPSFANLAYNLGKLGPELLSVGRSAVTAAADIVKGIWNQEVNPGQEEQQTAVEQLGGPGLLGNMNENGGGFTGLAAAVGKDLLIPAKVMTRFFQPIIQGAGQNIADAILANSGTARNMFGVKEEDIGLLPSSQQTVLQGVGNFMQLGFAIATPSIGKELGLAGTSETAMQDILRAAAGKSASEAFIPLVKIVGTEGAKGALHGAEAGLWFGTAQALQSGSTDPKEIGSIILKSAVGMGILGSLTGAAGPVKDAAMTALLKDVKREMGVPQKIYVDAKTIRDYVTQGTITEDQAGEILRELGVAGLQKQAREQGTNITSLANRGANFTLTPEEVINIADRPWFASVKGAFGLKPSSPVVIPGKVELSERVGLPAPAATALKEDIADALSRNHSSAAIAKEITKNYPMSDVRAQQTVKEVATEINHPTEPKLELPDFLQAKPGEEDILAEVTKASEASQEGQGKAQGAETTQELPQSVEDILGELSDSAEARQDWEENHADEFGQLAQKLDDLEKQFKDTKDKALRAKLKTAAAKISDKMGAMENDFIAKYEEQAKQIAKEWSAKQAAAALARGEEPEPPAAEDRHYTAAEVVAMDQNHDLLPFDEAILQTRELPVPVDLKKKDRTPEGFKAKIKEIKKQRDESIAQLKEMWDKGSESLSEYERNMYGAPDGKLSESMGLVQNHISYYNSQIDWLEREQRGENAVKPLTPKDKALVESYRKAFARAFELYDKIRDEHPDYLVAEAQEPALNKLAEELNLTQDQLDFIDRRITRMGSGILDTPEEFEKYIYPYLDKMRAYGMLGDNGQSPENLGRELPKGPNPERGQVGGDEPGARRNDDKELGGNLARRERGGSGAGVGERPLTPIKKKPVGDNAVMPERVFNDTEPKGESEVPVKQDLAKAYVAYYERVRAQLGESWTVDDSYKTPKGAISLAKAHNPAGPGSEGDTSVILWKDGSEYGVHLFGSGKYEDYTGSNTPTEIRVGMLTYRVTRKDVKYTGFQNQWTEPTKQTPFLLARQIENLVELQERIEERSPAERSQRVEKEAEQKRDALDTSNDEIKNIVEAHTTIDGDGDVRVIMNDAEELQLPSESQLEVINAYSGAGGKEKKGAEGRGLLDEYYTPSDVTTMTAAVLERLGAFRDGMQVLEPSAGTGAFLNDFPTNAAVQAHEINETAARILKLNHPEASVSTKPFESLFMTDRGVKLEPKKLYDVVIGNPPYGKHRGTYKGLGEEKNIANYEEYFIKRSLDLTKIGGHVAMVVPSGFMRGDWNKAKEAITRLGKIEAAYRLPNGAFPTTDIGTDIVIFKRVEGNADGSAIYNDQYFDDHPDHILGEVTERNGRFGKEPAVFGTLESAADMFFTQLDQEYAEGQAPGDDEAQAGIAEDLADSYKPEVYKEVREKAPKPAEVEETPEAAKARVEIEKKNKKATVQSAKTDTLLDLSKYTLADEKEAALWKYVQPTGELAGDFPKEGTFYYAGKYYNGFNYLQGDIYDKLDQLERDKKNISKEQYASQKKALEAVLPERVGVDRMSVSPNSRFAQDIELTMQFDPEEGDITAPLSELFSRWLSTLPMSAFGESNLYAIRGYIRNMPVRGSDKIANEAERRTRRVEGDRLFKLFTRDNIAGKLQAQIEDQYNRQFNSYVRPNYRQVPLVGKLNSTFKGRPLEIRDVQLQGIGFLVNRGVGLLAHDVGIGKTMQSIIAINEILARGWAKRPLIVVPSPNVYVQWVKEMQELLPDVRINLLANLGGDFKGDLATLEIPEGSISIVTEEGFKRLGFSNETYADLTSDFLDVIENPNETRTKRAEELGKSKAEEEVAKGIRGTKTERFFEDLAFDHLTIDEIHNANHIISRAKMEQEGQVSEFRGFQTKPSIFGIKTWLAAQYIQKKYNGRNVVGASATPFTNNPLEYYSILSLMARDRMRRMGLLNVNDFMTAFMEISTQHEFKADGAYSEKSEVRSFKNYQQFQKLLTEFIDFRDGVEAGVKRPTRVSHEYVVGETPQAAQYKEAAQELFADKEHAGALKAIGELRAIAFSPYLSRYHQGGIPSTQEFIDNSPKLKAMVEIIKQSLKDNHDAGHLIYSPVGVEYFPLIKQALVAATGLKDGQVDIISGSTPKPRRSAIQDAFNKGTVKIVIGSDAIQEGVNLQENTSDLHILSLPWNFTAVRQVIGRAWRQGNQWPRVRVNTYFTENSVDVFLSQKLQNKEKRYEEALKYKGDDLDVGDINFEEMKLDLITDPVRRTELEYQFKEQEINHEIKRFEAEQGYKLRRAAELVEAQDRLNNARETYTTYKDDWAKRGIEDAERRLTEVRDRLKERGINVADVESQLAEGADVIKKLEDKKAELAKEKEQAVAKAQGERLTVAAARQTDFGAMTREREAENKTFYDLGKVKPMLRTAGGVTREEEWGKVMDQELTPKQLEAVTIAREYAMRDEEIPKTVLKDLNAAYKKYLDFMDTVKKMARDANAEGMPFDLTEADGERAIRTLFDTNEVDFLFKRNAFTGDQERDAWGLYTPSRGWRNPLIRLVSNEGMIQSKVLYHEAFHAYMDRFVPKEERVAVLEGVRNNIFTKPMMAVKLVAQKYRTDEVAEEWLADDFARFASGEEYAKENQSFYQRILNKIRAWIRKVTGAQRIYDDLLARKRPGPRRLAVLEVKDEEIEHVPGDQQDDFAVRAKLRSVGIGGWFDREKRESEKKIGKDLAEKPEFADQNRDLIRKDITHIEDMTAQARDLFLRDPNEFAAADAYQHHADTRRVKKAALDKYFADVMAPYFKDLNMGEKEKVNKVLMKGDEEGKDYSDDELKAELNAKQITAYKAVRKAFNTAHQLLLAKMREAGVPEDEIKQFEAQRVGYMPHKWPYRYAVKHQVRTKEGPWYTYQMDNFKSQRQARAAWEALKAKNVRADVRYSLDTLDSLQVDFFSEQRLSFDAMRSAIVQAKTGDEIKATMIDALRDMVKEKGFGRQYLRRTGTRGYDQKNVPKIIADYFSGMNGYLTKMEAAKKYYQTLSTIDARRQAKFYGWMRDMIAYDMGHTREWDMAKRGLFIAYLANDISFLLTNATQNFQVGAGELSKYLTGASKALTPELRIIKAMTDWATGRVSAEERKAAEDLMKIGELGGEMTAELMGFKNNPIYSEISSGFNKALYNSTGIVERHVNRVPAFIAARRIFLEQGMTEAAANEKALGVSNDIHFRYGKQNRPRFERGRIGTLFVFFHYMRSFLYQLSRDATQGEYASFARKMLWTVMLGGTVSLPFGQSLLLIWRSIFGNACNADNPEACAAEANMPAWEVALTHGIPATTGLDLSGRVGIDLMNFSELYQDPNDIRGYLGAAGNVFWMNPWDPSKGGRIEQGLELLREGRFEDAAGKLLPDMLANPIKGYTGATLGVRSFAGTPLDDGTGQDLKYNTWEGIIRALGFTPTRENIAYDIRSQQLNSQSANQAAATTLRRSIESMVQKGDLAGARTAQNQGIADGTIAPGTNYIKAYGKDTFIKTALDEWNSGSKTSTRLAQLENGIISDIYGAKATAAQKLAVRKEFAVYRTFGLDDPTANALVSAKTTEDAAQVLIKAHAEMSANDFASFLHKAQSTVLTSKGTASKILVTDPILKQYQKDLATGKTAPTDVQQGKQSEGGFIDTVLTYAAALGTDPVTAFNRIATGQTIRRVDNGTIIVTRMSLDSSEAEKRAQAAGGSISGMRLDHTIPLELGGDNGKGNLKLVTEAEWNSYTPIENLLGGALRAGSITKSEAQDWITRFKNKQLTAAQVKSMVAAKSK